MDLGLQQKEIAQLLGVHPTNLVHWEKDRTTPTYANWRAIINFLGFDPSPEPQSLPDQLKALRRRNGWSLKDLAAHLTIDPSTAATWERGHGDPWRWRRNELAQLLRRM